MSRHLSSEQLDQALAVDMNNQLSETAAEHLQDCSICRQEVANIRAVLGDFRSHATLVAERQRRIGVLRERPRVPRMAWALAAAALFVSVGAPLAVRHFDAPHADVPVVQAPAGMSDEALLDSVQDDLSNSVPEPLLPLAGTSSSSGSGSASGSTNLRNQN